MKGESFLCRSVPQIIFLIILLCVMFPQQLSVVSGSMLNGFEPLQVTCEVNGFIVPAVIDTGAEISVMSTSCAKRCRVWSNVDSRLCGKAVGVGVSDIIGGIEALPIKIGQINFANKISILRDARCEFLIGMDILKRFESEISIKDRILKVQIKDKTLHIPLIDHSKYTSLQQEKQQQQQQQQQRQLLGKITNIPRSAEEISKSLPTGGRIGRSFAFTAENIASLPSSSSSLSLNDVVDDMQNEEDEQYYMQDDLCDDYSCTVSMEGV